MKKLLMTCLTLMMMGILLGAMMIVFAMKRPKRWNGSMAAASRGDLALEPDARTPSDHDSAPLGVDGIERFKPLLSEKNA